MTTTTPVSVCPRCGTIEKSGKMSCCGRDGSWFRNCGSASTAKLRHTWYEGIQSCKARPQSKTDVGHQLNVPQQKVIDSSQDAVIANGQPVTGATKAFAFTSDNTSSRSMSDTPANVFTTTTVHTLTESTSRVYLKVSSSNNPSAIASLTTRECVDLLTIIVHIIFLIILVVF